MRKYLLIATLCLCIGVPLLAETITLKDGTIINGTVLSQDATSMKVQSSFGVLTIEKFNILNVNFSNNAPSSQDNSKPVQVNVNNNNNNNNNLNNNNSDNYDNSRHQEKAAAKNNNQRPVVKWGIGIGAPYAIIGNQIGVVLSDQLEIFAAFTSVPGYTDPYNYHYSTYVYSTYTYDYKISAYGIRYYYDTTSPAWIPGTGAYVSFVIMPYTYNYDYQYGSYAYSKKIKYSYDVTLAGLSVGIDGKFGIFRANLEIGYGFAISEKLSITYGTQTSEIKPGGLLLAVGLGLAL